MQVEVLAEVLDRVAQERRDEHEAAIQQREWRKGLETLFTSLIWRTIALALRQKIASPQFDPRTDPVDLARRLLVDCTAALHRLTPSNDKADLFHKTETVADVLYGILDVVGVLEAWTGADPHEPFFLSVISTRLGQAEVELNFAENGFWEQVAKWRDQKPAGRGVGWRVKWRGEAAPQIQAWIDSDPTMNIKAIVNKLWDWLVEYKKKNPDEKLPDYDSLRKALAAMQKDKMIQLPGK